MNVIWSIILGVIQGITEFLPVSSSGHLAAIPFLVDIPQQSLWDDAVLHLGTLAALIIYFRADVVELFKSGVNIIKKLINEPPQKLTLDYFGNDKPLIILAIGVIPAGIAGVFFGDRISEATSHPVIVALSLIFFGLVMLAVDRRSSDGKSVAEVDEYDSFMIGGAQALALIRGISRSGATITGARLLGFSRKAAAKFSFLLSIPTVMLAGGYALVQVFAASEQIDILPLAAGFIASTVSGFFAIRLLMNLFERVGMKPFVMYRIALGLILIILFILRTYIFK